MAYWKRFALRNELDTTSGGGDAGGGGMDIAAAVDEIGAGLGLSKGPDEGLGNGETVNEEVAEPKAQAPAPSPAPAPAPTPAPTAAPAPTTAPAAAAPATPARFTAAAPPTTWSATAAAGWAALPEPVREEIAKRENDMFRGLEQYRADARAAQDYNKALGPMREVLAQHNVPAAQFVSNLTQAHLTLANPQLPMEQKVAFVQKLANDYGINLGAAPVDPATDLYVDPQVKGLQDKIVALESRLNGEDQRKATAAQAETQRSIDAFASDPANPYFDEVALDVAMLIRGSGGQLPLKEAYDRAVWANPATRAKETARLQAEATSKATKEAADRAAAAEKAARGRVRTNGHQGNGTVSTGSMEDTMAETLKAMRSREARG